MTGAAVMEMFCASFQRAADLVSSSTLGSGLWRPRVSAYGVSRGWHVSHRLLFSRDDYVEKRGGLSRPLSPASMYAAPITASTVFATIRSLARLPMPALIRIHVSMPFARPIAVKKLLLALR